MCRGRTLRSAQTGRRWTRRREDGQEVSLRRHVVDGVVDEDSIERLAEPNGSHVADMMGDAWVQPPRVRKHQLREVDGCRVEFADQLVEVVAAAGAQVEGTLFARRQPRPEFVRPVARLPLVMLGRVHQWPQVGDVAVEAVLSVRHGPPLSQSEAPRIHDATRCTYTW